MNEEPLNPMSTEATDKSSDTKLLEGELLSWTPDAASLQQDVLDEVLEEKYVSGEMRIVVEQARYPLKQVPDLLASADYNLQPDFQRRPRWSVETQSRLIESFIMNVPIPPVFLYEVGYSRFEVMDGKQRLTAIGDFYRGDFALTGLAEWPELNGRKYEELPEQLQRGIDRRYLSSIVLLHETAKTTEQADRLKQLVFERINTGGTDLSDQEKRNALYPGRMNSLCIELSRYPPIAEMWGIPVPTETEGSTDWQPPKTLLENAMYRSMEDVELVLRFFAHRQRRHLWRSGTRLDDYLTQYQRDANRYSPELLAGLGSMFRETAQLCLKVLGPDAFHLLRERSGTRVWVARPALIAYDPLMWAFSQTLDYVDVLIDRRQSIKQGIEQLYIERYEAFDGRKTNLVDIATRDDLVLGLIQRYIS